MTSAYRSIGEVLSLLSEEHPDLTISKIRFLESQGLISPERTSSGYRKFFDADVELLDWVLTQQRDHFLPLKEIKRRIASGAVTSRLSRGAKPLEAAEPRLPSLFNRSQTQNPDEENPVSAAAAASVPDSEPVSGIQGSVSLNAAELAKATGTDIDFIVELRRMGFLKPLQSAGSDAEAVYDHMALLITRTAAALVARGLPTRTLRMFKVSADREVGVYEQLLASVRARGDTARLSTELTELVDLTEALHRQLLQQMMHPYLG